MLTSVVGRSIRRAIAKNLWFEHVGVHRHSDCDGPRGTVTKLGAHLLRFLGTATKLGAHPLRSLGTVMKIGVHMSLLLGTVS